MVRDLHSGQKWGPCLSAKNIDGSQSIGQGESSCIFQVFLSKWVLKECKLPYHTYVGMWPELYSVFCESIYFTIYSWFPGTVQEHSSSSVSLTSLTTYVGIHQGQLYPCFKEDHYFLTKWHWQGTLLFFPLIKIWFRFRVGKSRNCVQK